MSTTATITPDEQPKKETAKKVVTPKRKYFFPDHSVEVEADSQDEAVKLATKSNKQEEATE